MKIGSSRQLQIWKYAIRYGVVSVLMGAGLLYSQSASAAPLTIQIYMDFGTTSRLSSQTSTTEKYDWTKLSDAIAAQRPGYNLSNYTAVGGSFSVTANAPKNIDDPPTFYPPSSYGFNYGTHTWIGTNGQVCAPGDPNAGGPVPIGGVYCPVYDDVAIFGRNQAVGRHDYQDFMQIEIGSDSASADSGRTINQELGPEVLDFYGLAYQGTAPGGQYWVNRFDKYVTQQYYYNDLGGVGEFTATTVLSTSTLALLTSLNPIALGNAADQVFYTVYNTQGDFFVQSATLNLVLEENPVPAPAALMLLGFGLISLGAMRRKRA